MTERGLRRGSYIKVRFFVPFLALLSMIFIKMRPLTTASLYSDGTKTIRIQWQEQLVCRWLHMQETKKREKKRHYIGVIVDGDQFLVIRDDFFDPFVS